jgi:DNA-binding IscR family transcriptional regulator
VYIGDVVKVLEGSLVLIGCVGETETLWCDRMPTCHTRKVWVKLSEGIEKALRGMTLADVIESEEPQPARMADRPS